MMKLGSRGSPWRWQQSRLVAAMLAKISGLDVSAFPIEAFMTSGDRIQGRLQDQGGKGLFTKELDEALLDGRIDAAIHSMKDLPTRLPAGLVLAAVPAREDPRDGFIALHAKSLMDLPPGATVGTASLRRQAQTLHLRPDLKVEMLRGRVETRLAKIEGGAFDATYLALAGLKRLGLEHHAASVVDAEIMPPAPGQGALAITARADDQQTLALLETAEYRRTCHHHHRRARLPAGAGRFLPHAHRGAGEDQRRHPGFPGRSADAGRQALLAAAAKACPWAAIRRKPPGRWAPSWARRSWLKPVRSTAPISATMAGR